MKYFKNVQLISAIGDFIIMNFLFNIVFCYLKGFSNICLDKINILFFFYINIIWLVSVLIFKAYKIDWQVYKKAVLFIYVKIIVFFFFLFILFFQVLPFDYYQHDNIKILFSIFFGILIIWKYLLYYIFTLHRKSEKNYRNVIIVGYNDKATQLKDYFLENPWTGYQFRGFFTDKKSDKKNVIGTYNELEEYTISNSIDEIYILMNSYNKSVYKIISSIISKHPIKIRLIPDFADFSFMNIKLVDYDTVPIVKIQQGPLSLVYNRAIKRFFDITISILVIVLILSWLIPILAILDLLLTREGVFFIQRRPGLNKKPFNLIKFKTMKKNGVADTKQAIKNDGRVTTIGKIMRTTSIDELPQFFNVLTGNMSVIGPRPHMWQQTEDYKAIVKKFMIRHTIKPGITGYAQVRGYRGEIKCASDIKKRIKLDLIYIENWTIWFDVKIILLTIKNLMKKDSNAY